MITNSNNNFYNDFVKFLRYGCPHVAPKERRTFSPTEKEKAVEVAPRLCFKMVIQEGFEPPTHGLEGRCSIQLSY